MVVKQYKIQQVLLCGDVAQMGERCVRNAQVEGSNPFISTMEAMVPLQGNEVEVLLSIRYLSFFR